MQGWWHIRFYTIDEFTKLSNDVGLTLEESFFTKISFPRRNVESYMHLFGEYNKDVIDGYGVHIVDNEILITERVVNLLFRKQC